MMGRTILSHSFPLSFPVFTRENVNISLCTAPQSGHGSRTILALEGDLGVLGPSDAGDDGVVPKKTGVKYCPLSDKSASSKCTSRSSRWQYFPFSPAFTFPLIKLVSSSMVPGHHPRSMTSFDPHCLLHSSMRFTRLTARPTLRWT